MKILNLNTPKILEIPKINKFKNPKATGGAIRLDDWNLPKEAPMTKDIEQALYDAEATCTPLYWA